MLDVLFLYKCTYLCCSMSLILNIETATKNCSVSLAESGKVIAIKELNDGNYSHAEKLHVFINEVLKVAKKSMKDVDAVAVSKGPGSFTGLRIGVSSAKGLCYALNIPLISIDTLESLSCQLVVESGCIVPMLDARRLEVYSTIFDKEKNLIRKIEAQILNEDSFADYLKDGKVYFIGDGVPKTKELINHPNANFIANKLPSANEMAQLSFDKFQKKIFEDVAYFEPFYLKDFVVTPQKKK